MKRYIILPLIALGIVSCDTKEKFDYTGHDNLYYEIEENKQLNFFYMDNSVRSTTVYFTVNATGGPKGHNRQIDFEQVGLADKGEILKAQPGVHFVAFDDPQYDGRMVMPAGQVRVQIPIFVLRDESLESTAFYLALKLLPGDGFTTEIPSDIIQTVDIMDMPFRPTNWDDNGAAGNFFGKYNSVKHRFMIDLAGEPVDELWLERLFEVPDEIQYFSAHFKAKLIEFNEDPDNIASGAAPLRDGDYIVSFEAQS